MISSGRICWNTHWNVSVINLMRSAQRTVSYTHLDVYKRQYPTGDWFTDSLYFHYIDNDNYYILKVIGNQSDDDWAKESRRTVTLLKKANGTEEKLAGTQLGAMPASGNDAYLSLIHIYSAELFH